MPSELHIRSALIDQLDAISAIWLEMMEVHEQMDPSFRLAEDGSSRWRGMTEAILRRKDAFVYVAWLEGEMVGFVLGWIAQNPPIYANARVGFVSEIAVRKSARRRGVARALMHRARDFFSAQGVHEFQLSTAIGNDGAHRLWRSLGGEKLLVRYRFSCAASSSGAGPTEIS